MHVRRAAPRLITSLAALATSALAATALATSAAQAAPEPAPAAEAVAPEAGTCWDYTYRQAIRSSYKGTPVDCELSHTVETVITLDVPASLAAKGNASRELVLWMDERCQPAVNRYAGVADPTTAAPGTRTWFLWYTPTAKQWKAGSHWVSCAAASVPTYEKKLGVLIPVLGSIKDAPEKSRPIIYNTDFGKGTYLARKPMTELADRPYPGSSGLQRKAAGFCERMLGHDKFFWYGPSSDEWKAGYTAIRCYSLKKR